MNGNSARTFVFAPTLLRSLGSSRPQTRRSHIRRASFRSSTVAAARVLPECGGPSMKSNLGAIDSCASAMTRFAATISASRRIVFPPNPRQPARAPERYASWSASAAAECAAADVSAAAADCGSVFGGAARRSSASPSASLLAASAFSLSSSFLLSF